MRAPHLIPPARAARTTGTALLVVLAVLAAMLVRPVGAQADGRAAGAAGAVSATAAPRQAADPVRPPVGSGTPLLQRGDGSLRQAREEGRDVPTLPAGCFGPAQGGNDPEKPCLLTPFKKVRPTVVLWGDSHAWQMVPAATLAAKGTGVNLVSFLAGSCAPQVVSPSELGVCGRSNTAALAYVTDLHRRGKKVKVLLGSNWAGFRQAYRTLQLAQVGVPNDFEPYTVKMVKMSHEGTPALFTRLGRLGVDVSVIAQAAVVPAPTAPCAAGDDPYQCDIARWRALPEEGRTAAWLRGQLQKITGRRGYVETTASYCNALVCHGNVGGISTFFDHLHLSASRSRTLAPAFKSTFTSMRAKR